MDKKTLKFSWGDTSGLREKILSVFPYLKYEFQPIGDYGYPPYDGVPELVGRLHSLTKMLTGKKYKYICVTAGCTHAVNASINALANSATDSVNTRELYYPRYPNMIALTPYVHQKWSDFHTKNCIAIVDSPSNPLGLIGMDKTIALNTDKIIWDAAYHSPTYGMLYNVSNVDHKVFCGSLSKLTGINGIRLGWTATDDESIHNQVENYVKNSICGVSYPSQKMAVHILNDKSKLMEYFFISRKMIDMNREEVLRLKHIFGQNQISPYGMFAFFKTDDKMEEIFKKAKVEFTSGKECGADYQAVRINLANSNEVTKEMVERILNADRS